MSYSVATSYSVAKVASPSFWPFGLPGSLNVIGLNRPIGSGTIRRCGLAGGSVS